MSRTLVTVDRVVGALVALALIALGLLLVDWKAGMVLSLPRTLSVAPVQQAMSTPWWPFATAAAAVILLVLGLRWLLSHLPRVRTSEARLSTSSASGRIRLDTASVARATAADLESEMVLPEAHGRVREIRGRALVQLDARCARNADLEDVRERSERVTRDMARAFPSGDLPLRVVVDAPRTRVRDRARRSNAVVQ